MILSESEIASLRKSHSPQPLHGRVGPGLHIAILSENRYGVWDSQQTYGYLCVTSLPILLKLLALEAELSGSVRELITDEPSPWRDITPPTPEHTTFSGSAKINIEDLLS